MQIEELYIEPSSRCNLACEMCSRKYWVNEATGDLEYALFEKVMGEMPRSVHRVFFGGVGEPLVHPRILDMVRAVKGKGRTCEVITNGTMLCGDMICSLLDAKIDKIWVSLDWVEDKSGADLGHQPDTLRSILRLKALRATPRYKDCGTKLCVMFVLMRQNADQLDKLMDRAEELGINEIKVTHLLPYDHTMESEICYGTLYPLFGRGGIAADIPFIDARTTNSKALRTFALQGRYENMYQHIPSRYEYCRFVQEGVVFVRWDGEVCPCMPLLHDNSVYQNGVQRKLVARSFGNVREAALQEIWNGAVYREFRDRVRSFSFSPCATCGACELFATNEEDCIGSPFPACGHCLWAYGLIRCP